MGRSILAVVVGYLVMAVLIMIGLFALYAATGTEWAYKPNSYMASTRWCVGMSAVGLVAAVVGGWVCARIAPRPGPLKFLVALVLIGGAVQGYVNAQKEDPGPRTGEVDVMQAAEVSRSPNWVLIATPLIGAVGLLIGGRRALGGGRS